MNFLNFLTGGASLFNFNLQNITSGFGFNSAASDNANKSYHPELVLKQPPTPLPEPPKECQVAEEGKVQTDKDERVELFTKQQQLINQYMHLNIQLLSKKLQNLEQVDKQPKQEQPQNQNELKSLKKKIKKVNNCGHGDREHYAKGMCSNCYHKYGRNKKPWNCPHDKLYANGMCQNCYINSYNRKRREERADGRQDSAQNEGSNDLKMEDV